MKAFSLFALIVLAQSPAQAADCVVFLHGLARTSASMEKAATAFENSGYTVANVSYPSRKFPIEELAPLAIEAGLEKCPANAVVHFVTHSLGGILVRYYLEHNEISNLGRVLMLAPPNRGSRVAKAVRSQPMFQWYFGPAGQELPDPAGWPAPPPPFAVIAGTCNASAFAPPGLLARAAGVMPPDEPSDGIVTVAETRLEGMHDFATVNASHTWIMNHPEARAMVLAYLADGRLRPRAGAVRGDC